MFKELVKDVIENPVETAVFGFQFISGFAEDIADSHHPDSHGGTKRTPYETALMIAKRANVLLKKMGSAIRLTVTKAQPYSDTPPRQSGFYWVQADMLSATGTMCRVEVDGEGRMVLSLPGTDSVFTFDDEQLADARFAGPVEMPEESA